MHKDPEEPNIGSTADEARLVAAAKDGNRAALESLLRRHYERCYALCRRLLGDDEDALDATQEAMIAVARGIGTFDGRSAFSTWVYRVTTNAAFDELRRRRRRPATDRWNEWNEPADGGEPLSTHLAGTAERDDVGDAVSARLTLDKALGLLSEEHRTAVVLRDMLDLEYSEIADVLRVPIGTVRSRIARGRAALAQSLSAAGGAASVAPTRDPRRGNSAGADSVKSPGPRL